MLLGHIDSMFTRPVQMQIGPKEPEGGLWGRGRTQKEIHLRRTSAREVCALNDPKEGMWKAAGWREVLTAAGMSQNSAPEPKIRKFPPLELTRDSHSKMHLQQLMLNNWHKNTIHVHLEVYRVILRVVWNRKNPVCLISPSIAAARMSPSMTTAVTHVERTQGVHISDNPVRKGGHSSTRSEKLADRKSVAAT